VAQLSPARAPHARRLLRLVIAVVALAGCTTAAPQTGSGGVVVSEHDGWTIRVSPSLSQEWRARVQVWPPDVDPRTRGGINLRFDESASDETAIVQSATTAARRYIDAARRQGSSWDPPWLRRLLDESDRDPVSHDPPGRLR
jgi:hypothetical protein